MYRAIVILTGMVSKVAAQGSLRSAARHEIRRRGRLGGRAAGREVVPPPLWLKPGGNSGEAGDLPQFSSKVQ